MHPYSVDSLLLNDAIWRHWSWLWQRRQAITWTNVDLSSKVICGIHLWISQKKFHKLNPQHMFGDYAFISLAHFPGANELTGMIVNHGANTVCNKAQSLKRSYFYSMIIFIHVRTLICFLLCNTFNQYRCEGLFPNYMFDSKHRHHH